MFQPLSAVESCEHPQREHPGCPGVQPGVRQHWDQGDMNTGVPSKSMFARDEVPTALNQRSGESAWFPPNPETFPPRDPPRGDHHMGVISWPYLSGVYWKNTCPGTASRHPSDKISGLPPIPVPILSRLGQVVLTKAFLTSDWATVMGSTASSKDLFMPYPPMPVAVTSFGNELCR